tara:strand:- start:514 stop:768 length:255 start_codon:yes stop_codon:yes gene_type:complete
LVQAVEAGGADISLIFINTMHEVAAEVQATVKIPLLHIADATAKQLSAGSMTKAVLLGTAFAMQQDTHVALYDNTTAIYAQSAV